MVTVRKRCVTPDDFGLTKHALDDFCGGGVADRVAVFNAVLKGERGDRRYGVLEVGAVRDFMLINAAAALFVVGKCADFKEGVELARKAIESGSVESVVGKYVKVTNRP